MMFNYKKTVDSTEFQWSIVPGAPLVITSMFGLRFKLGQPDAPTGGSSIF